MALLEPILDAPSCRARSSTLALVCAVLSLALWAAPAHAERRVTEQPAGGPAGSVVSLSGAGFLPRRAVVIAAAGSRLRAVHTDAHGAFAVRVRIAGANRSSIGLLARDARGHTTNRFAVSESLAARDSSEIATERGARLRWTPSVLAGSGGFTLFGSGFAPHARGVLTWLGAAIAVRTDGRGFFSRALSTPAPLEGATRGAVRMGGEHLVFRLGRAPYVPATSGAGTVGPANAPSPGAPSPAAGGPVPPVTSPDDPVIAAAGDVACAPNDPSFNNGNGTASYCRQKYTAALLSQINPTRVLGLGDLQYGFAGDPGDNGLEVGTLDDYQRAYDLSWGRYTSITYPTPSNQHDAWGGAGYFQYWSAARPEVANAGAYSPYAFDLGAWHLISLPSGCSDPNGDVDCAAIEQWLQRDLAAHSNRCTLAYWHNPYFNNPTAKHPATSYAPVGSYVRDLYAAHADVILDGDNHNYQRFLPQDPSGNADPRGVTEFVVGTGGKVLMPFTAPAIANTAARDDQDFGVLKLTLHPSSYDWQFIAEDGGSRDAGTRACS